MSKITLKCKKYKRKCIDKALSVYLEKAGYIFDSSSVEKVAFPLSSTSVMLNFNTLKFFTPAGDENTILT